MKEMYSPPKCNKYALEPEYRRRHLSSDQPADISTRKLKTILHHEKIPAYFGPFAGLRIPVCC